MYRRREIAIDLTALLDVILIILFMFVVRSTTAEQTTVDSTTLENNESKQIESLKKENENLKKQITTNSVLDDTCLVMTITIEGQDDGNKRQLGITKGTTDVEKVDYDWDNISYAKNKLKDKLNQAFKNINDTNQMILIIFQYDKNKVYNTDYKFVDSVLKDIQEDKDDIYLAYYDTADKVIVE